jgi:hypothetical protein
VIVGVGTDLIEVSRVQRALDRWGERFARKVLVDHELERFARHRKPDAILNGLGRAPDKDFFLHHDAPSIGFRDLVVSRVEVAAECIEVALGIEGHGYATGSAILTLRTSILPVVAAVIRAARYSATIIIA